MIDKNVLEAKFGISCVYKCQNVLWNIQINKLAVI